MSDTDTYEKGTYDPALFERTGEIRQPQRGEYFIANSGVVKRHGYNGWAAYTVKEIVVPKNAVTFIQQHNLLPTESGARKAVPLCTGVIDYFPAALVEVAKVSKAGNDKHNPGQPLHHARGKSNDHADAIARHLAERGGFDEVAGVKLRHSAELAWRALALLQQELEDAGVAPMARGASK